MTRDPLVQMLAEERLRQGLTQRQVAARAGLHPSLISKYELGIHGLTLQSLRCWAGALGWDVGLRRRR